MNTTRHDAHRRQHRTTRLAATIVGLALLASCGSAGIGTSNGVGDAATVEAANASLASNIYTINAGDTLSGIASRAGVSLDDLVATNGWSDGSSHLILPGDVINLPHGSTSVSPTPSAPAASTTSLSGSTAAAPTAATPSGGYAPISTPSLDSLQATQHSAPIVSPLPDGTYWSWDYSSDGKNVAFTLSQYFFGDACREQFGSADDACASDNNTLYSPSATVSLTGTAATSVTNCCKLESYAVSTLEFARLAAGFTPAHDAPAGFNYDRIAVLVTVQNGQAVAAHQVFTS